MDSILQGTTPTLTIELDPEDLNVNAIAALKFVMKQRNTVTEYNLSDVTVDVEENTISYRFTEEETFAFIADTLLFVQLRFLMVDGSICGTNRMTFSIDDFIGSEVLTP